MSNMLSLVTLIEKLPLKDFKDDKDRLIEELKSNEIKLRVCGYPGEMKDIGLP